MKKPNIIWFLGVVLFTAAGAVIGAIVSADEVKALFGALGLAVSIFGFVVGGALVACFGDDAR